MRGHGLHRGDVLAVREVCQKYGADLAKKKVADDKAQAETAAKPATEAKPGVGDTVKETAKSLKKLLKF